MRTHICTLVIAAASAVAFSAAPVAAQHGGGGGHGGGGHSGGGHASGGRAGGHAGGGATHVGGDRHASAGHVDVGRAVPRTTFIQPRVDHRTTVVLPSHRTHLGGFAAFGLLHGAYGYPYTYGYYPGYRYGYPGYYGSYGYSSGYYNGGYVDGHARLRILDAPRDAEVYVDGYYAGIVDNFDGVLQHLELTPGPHQIEIRAYGFAPLVFDVNAVGGRTITYRARMIPQSP